MATCNHIHLLIRDSGPKDTIAKSIQLVAARTGQEFNQRKKRKGAFWEDRYHATAVETGPHLVQCLVYIDLNMVRAGVVSHPSEWSFSGYNEILTPRRRYALIDYEALRDVLGFKSMRDVAGAYREWVEASLENKGYKRDDRWSGSVAVGSESFVRTMKAKLGIRAKGRKMIGEEDSYSLKESQSSYISNLGDKNAALRTKNIYYWNEIN
jgi:putative transposase